MPPYFFRYSQADVEEFFLCFAREAGGRTPLFLYNIPFFTTEIGIDVHTMSVDRKLCRNAKMIRITSRPPM